MTKYDFDRLFNQLDSLTVGFGPMFREFNLESQTYPPHNIIRIDDTKFVIELAVAGFKKSEITITENKGVLMLKGSKESEPESTYQHRGIGKRAFEKSFRIAEYYEIENAALEDGILSVSFVKNEPEETKPKLIAIE